MNHGVIYYRLPGGEELLSWPYPAGGHDAALAALLDRYPDADIDDGMDQLATTPAAGSRAGTAYPTAGVVRESHVPGSSIQSNLGMILVEHRVADRSMGGNPMEALLREARAAGATHVINAHCQPVMADGIIVGHLMMGDAVVARPG